MFLVLRNAALSPGSAALIASRCSQLSKLVPCSRLFTCTQLHTIRHSHSKSISDQHQHALQLPEFLDIYSKTINFPSQSTTFRDLYKKTGTGNAVTIYGYIGKRKRISKSLEFTRLTDPTLAHSVQIVSVESSPAFKELKSIRPNSAVVVNGIVKQKEGPKKSDGNACNLGSIEVELRSIQCLNEFPRDIIVTPETIFPPEQRHLQMRHDNKLRESLQFRAKANSFLRRALEECDPPFLEIETPVLFKSTPEGAREFVVPTRSPSLVYALPQSPQQYKQMLMASGIPRYYQFARCFRDEDLRADRQPEFTQLDLEMSFATAEDVMNTTENLVCKLWASLMPEPLAPGPFPRMKYRDAMASYGSDKPDTRIGMEIHQVEHLPSDLISKISPLESPIVEAFKFEGNNYPAETWKFLTGFMESRAGVSSMSNPDGGPGTFVFDSMKPVSGLSALGFEAAEMLEKSLGLQDGDLLVIQARKNQPFHGGSTAMGELRLAMYDHAVNTEFCKPASGFNFLWVTHFPLFSPAVDSEPGQGGVAGIASTHHPFTAPRTPEDVALLSTEPTKAIADHYDLVVNGVELGGGSRRIHSSAVQQFILKDILKIQGDRLSSFSHLLDCLRAGCPPHAGIALGFDRLIAIMTGTNSVRNVIAFPKNNRGEDPTVKSPSRIHSDTLATYHLQIRTKE
ncbi:hypothetical protein FQN57_000825 [Myotisia sp. PD_48]|nr:hypothetical protein FQN57_000825 [Myotisia sp. PD_48]